MSGFLNSKGLGYKADKADDRDRHLSASVDPAVFRVPDLSAYVGRVRDQGDTGSCVGQALAAAIEMTSAARFGVPVNLSPRWLYAIAREAEKKGAIADDGSFPRLAMQAARARGLLKESAFPFSVEDINRRPAPADSLGAFDAKGLAYYRIEATGRDRLDALTEALIRGYGVLFGMNVDAAYTRNEGDTVRGMGTSIGGHMQTAVAVDGVTVRVLNSWGTGWGDRGFVDFDAAYFSEAAMSDIYAVTWVPDATLQDCLFRSRIGRRDLGHGRADRVSSRRAVLRRLVPGGVCERADTVRTGHVDPENRHV